VGGELRIRFLDVGQGDAIVGVLPGGRRAFVVDACRADPVLDLLESEGISEVVLFLTHSDRDHTRGAQDLLVELDSDHNPARVLAIFFSRDRITATKGGEFERLVRFIGRIERRLSRRDPRHPSADFNTVLNELPAFAELFDPVRVYVVHPEKADQDSLIGATNETAGVLLMEHTVNGGGCHRVLLTADVQLTGISLILDRVGSVPVRADVFKYPHHGAWPTKWPRIRELDVPRKTMRDVLYAVSPSHVVFSVGSNNSHDHIRPEALTMLSEYANRLRLLRSVTWTETTEACRHFTDLPAVDTNAAADVEVRIGDYPGQIALVRLDPRHRERVLGCLSEFR